jgi:hypothetical protein
MPIDISLTLWFWHIVFLYFSVEDYQFESEDEETTLLNRWLYTPRNDGKPWVLILLLPTHEFDSRYFSTVSHFIDNLKMVIFFPIN